MNYTIVSIGPDHKNVEKIGKHHRKKHVGDIAYRGRNSVTIHSRRCDATAPMKIIILGCRRFFINDTYKFDGRRNGHGHDL